MNSADSRPTATASIGAWSAGALVAGNMIGAGVFTTSGFALADLGSRSSVLLAWVVGGLIALCGAWSYVRLASALPGNGGEYLFLSRSVHPLAGFLAGWVSLLAGFTAPIAVAAHGLEAYVSASFDIPWPSGLLGATAIVAAGLAHGVARHSGLRIQNVAVGVQVAAILAFIVLGGFAIPDLLPEIGASESVQAGKSVSISAFAVTLIWVSFSYSGWNAAIYVADEMRDPRRTLMPATLIGTAGVVVLYVLLNAVFVYSAPIELLSGHAEVGAIAAEALGGVNARRAISVVVALGLGTSISAMVMVGPRIFAKMADDGVLPSVLRSGAAPPRAAIALQVGLALFAFFMAELRDLLLYVGFLLGLSAAGTVACLFVVARDQRGDQQRPSRLHPWLPLIFICATLASAGFLIVSEPVQAVAGLGTLGLGAAIYWATSRAR